MNNKEKILLAALALFNEKGTKGVSTNHIAKAAGVSPGNLYYYFKNKEDIILEIYKTMVIEFDCTMGDTREITLEGLERHFAQIIEVQWQFLFLMRESHSLIERDERLKAIFQEQQERRLKEIADELCQGIQAGLLRPLAEEAVRELAEVLWIVSLFYIPFVASRGEEITKETVTTSVARMRSLLNPYLILP